MEVFFVRIPVLIVILLLLTILPAAASAADLSFNMNISRFEDGTTCGELIINNNVIWRLMILTDGAMPVSQSFRGGTTCILPDIVHGMLTVKVQHDSK